MESKDKILKIIESEIEGLIYKKPKCDFEHIWNCAIDKSLEVVESFKEDEYIELNEDKFKPTVDFGKKKNETHKKRN